MLVSNAGLSHFNLSILFKIIFLLYFTKSILLTAKIIFLIFKKSKIFKCLFVCSVIPLFISINKIATSQFDAAVTTFNITLGRNF